ncbi:hypothetical protein N7492_008541 [Penicillium capsulatum]|uniref:DUF4419 domain-containing protein n=1 Tax=Penicillium capsulatum TaxID=69766 RepID=A0A9W9HPX6_9EURO|nr:hypothetical protein N7492_008541 [Penicillium capsulatum]KAJ6105946.1 hypothetical protein N7512_009463 [Penicillium capsulatum]
MPVTLKTSDNEPVAWKGRRSENAEDFLACACESEYYRFRRVLQSSFSNDPQRHISPSTHGLVHAVWNAYSDHHNLILRPEDVWFSILVQLSFYINAHAEELRAQFVAHSGQKHLKVTGGGSLATVDVGELAIRLTELVQENVADPKLRTWMMPSFSTTTRSDEIVAAVIMMGTMQKYFSYEMEMVCGIPSVTLLGEKEDWEQLRSKIEKISTFGEEPSQFASLLKPILDNFVASFDDSPSSDIQEFWNRCVHLDCMASGADYLTGWVTVFCFWDAEGNSIYNDGNPRVDTEDIPAACVSVPVKVNDNGCELETSMVAGVVGIEASSRGNGQASDGEAERNWIQPFSGWWMFEELSQEELGEKKEKDRLEEEARNQEMEKLLEELRMKRAAQRELD